MSENQRSNGLRNYFDVNRMMKLRDKFDEQDAITILEYVIVQITFSKKFIFKYIHWKNALIVKLLSALYLRYLENLKRIEALN